MSYKIGSPNVLLPTRLNLNGAIVKLKLRSAQCFGIWRLSLLLCKIRDNGRHLCVHRFHTLGPLRHALKRNKVVTFVGPRPRLK